MQIGIDISRLAASQRTGTEHYTWELLAALGAIDQINSYRLYANQRPAALPPLPPNYLLRVMPWRRLWTHLRLSAELLRTAPDVLFIPAHVLPLVHPVRSVVTIHDLGYLHYPAAHPTWQRIYLRLSTMWSARQASHLIADSQATQRDLVRYCRVAPNKISVIYLGVSPRFVPVTAAAAQAAVAARYGLRSPFLLFIGTVQPRKNLVRLISAFAQARLANVQLVIAGKRGWLTEEIERLAAAQGVAVHFTGYVADADVPALISAARALLLPSLYEGFGLPALEAMACGTPVLAAHVSSLPEVVGDAGVLVDPLDIASISDGLRRLALDDPLHAELRERGLARAAAWRWSHTAQATLHVLQAVAAGHDPVPTAPNPS